MDDWYYRLHGRTHGPVTVSQVKFLIEQQRLGASDEVREGTAGNWVAVAQVDWKHRTDDSTARSVGTKRSVARGSKLAVTSSAVTNPPASGGSSSDLFDDLLVEEAAPQAVLSASRTLSKSHQRPANSSAHAPRLAWAALGLSVVLLITAAGVWGWVAHRKPPVDPSHVALLMMEADAAFDAGELSRAYEQYGRALELLGRPDPSDIAAVEMRARAIAASNEIVNSLEARNRATEAAQARSEEISGLTAEQLPVIRHAQQLQAEWNARQSANRLQEEQPVRLAAQRWLTQLCDSNASVSLGATELQAIGGFTIREVILNSASAVAHADVVPHSVTALSPVRSEPWVLTLRLFGEEWTVVHVDVEGEGGAPANPAITDTPASGPSSGSVEQLAADEEHNPSDAEPDDGGKPVAPMESDETPEDASQPPQSPTPSGLPRPPVAQPSPSPSSSPGRTPPRIVVQLADGSNFDLDRLLADVQRLVSEAPRNEESNDHRLALTQSDSSDVPVAVFSYESSKLQGPCWLYDQSGALAFAAEYRQGKEHGLLVIVQDGRPVFVEQYQGGQLEGPCILFREDRPWVVPVYSDGELQFTNIYDSSGTYERLVSGNQNESVPSSLLIRSREELDEEHQAGRRLSRSIKREFDEQVKAYRLKLAAELSVQKRQNQRVRSAVRLEAGATLRGEIIRRHLRGQAP